jgi:tyrosyl-tRNA synthetase
MPSRNRTSHAPEVGVIQAQAATNLLFDTDLANIRAEEAAEALKYDPRYHALEDTQLLGMPLTKLASRSGLTHSRGEYNLLSLVII